MKAKVELGGRGFNAAAPQVNSPNAISRSARFGFGRTHNYLPGMGMGTPETLGESCSALFPSGVQKTTF